MYRGLKVVLSAALATGAILPVAPAAYADDAHAAQEAPADQPGSDASTEAGSDQVSPLLVTEVQTDQSGYTYAEVFNNSDAPINFKDYIFFYTYEGGMGTGRTFGATGATYGPNHTPVEYEYGSKDQDLNIDPGKSLVLWFDNKNKTADDFNKHYNVNLTENKDLLHIPYSGIHGSAKRGFFFGKDSDEVMVRAWSNFSGDELTNGDGEQNAIQYNYSGSGRDMTDAGNAPATPGSVDASQVPAERTHFVESQAQVSNVKATGDGNLTVTAEVPYQGTSASKFVTLHWKQSSGDFTSDERTVEMLSTGDGKTFTATVPADQLFGDKATVYVTAKGNTGTEATSGEVSTALKPTMPVPEKQAPLYITEVHANPQSTDGKQYSYFEVYNDSDKPINLSYFKIFYYYNYPAQTAAQSGKTWSLDDFTAVLEPGKSMVYWLSSNGTTVDDFNKFYGTNLEEGKSIVQVNYAGLHSTDNRWIRFGTSEDDAFTVAGFNRSADELSAKDTSLQYAAPHGDGTANESIAASVSKATPGEVADWQKPSQTAKFQGYPGYPADDGQAPTLALNKQEPDFQLPKSIDEGQPLQVMYDTDLLLGATGDQRRDDFQNGIDPDNPSNYPGGNEALKDRPYMLGTEILYKLDDATEWTTIRQKTQWRLGHFLMQIPSDVLFGHDKVTYKVRSYTLYGMSESPEETVAINRLNDVQGLRVNAKNGDLLRGTETISANDGGDNAKTEISVDGQKQQTHRMMEDGAWFMVQTSGMNNYFKNAITAPLGDNPRDILTIMGTWAESLPSRAVHVDNKYFKYNEATDSYDVTLTLWAGDSGTPFEEIYPVVKDANHEDYNVTGLQIKLANGKSYLPTKIAPDNPKTNTSTALDASHTIGDSAGMEIHLDASFSIPASDVTAVGADIDTTKLADGEHTVSATDGTATTQAKVVVDNTAPTINLGVKPDETVYQPFTLSAANVAKDDNGVAQVEVSLDGEPLALPAKVTPRDLKEGKHTLAAVAIDEAGNVAKSEVSFATVKADPTVKPGEGAAADNGQSAQLKVNVADGPADVAFYQGRSLTEENGGVKLVGGQSSTSNGAFPYQLYSVDLGKVATGDDVSFTWDGNASGGDDEHPLAAFSYDYAHKEWQRVALADENGHIKATFPAADHTTGGKAPVLVQRVTDGAQPDVAAPTQDVLEGNSPAAQAAAEAPEQSSWDGTGRPANYDFSFAWETDTQYYSESFPYHYDNMNQWIVDHRDDWNIRYVLHTGDIVDDVDMTGEWINADHSMKIFDDANMPYGVLGGNHDVYAGMEGYGNYWKYFGQDRFKDKDYYGGSYNNNLGHYDLLSEDGQDFIVLYMSWDIYTDQINWMNEVLAKYPNRKAIIALHRYTNVKAADSLLDYTGQLLQEEVVAKNPNVFAVLNGHYHGASIETTSFDDNGDGQNDRTVYQICTDYQSDPEGGSEYIKFLYFDLKNNKVYLNSYSPYRNDFNYYDTAKQTSYAAGTNHVDQDIVELDVPFGATEKTISTKSAKADVLTDQQIGTLSGVNGDAAITWSGLLPYTTYGWYAKVTNDRGGLTVTDVNEFTTAGGQSFSDVDPNAWYARGVGFASAKGLMTGYEGTNLFGVGESLTRAQLAAILQRYAEPDYTDDGANATGMADVESGQWYTSAANWAVAKGVINGVEEADGSRTFRPNDPVTFEQAISVLGNLLAQDKVANANTSILGNFVDGDQVSDWARQSIAWGAASGLVNGYDEPEGRVLDPQAAVTRERAATILMNAFEIGLLS